ncbi:PBS lyase [Spirochaetia bacterium]|nr:PBS lyase [Spirochaetia bacterium]
MKTRTIVCILCLTLPFKLCAQTAVPPLPEDPAPAPVVAPASTPTVSNEEQRLRIIRYGTDTEIANLIKTLRGESAETGKENPLDGELLALAEKTKNRSILSGIFGYFGDTEKKGLEKRAQLAIEDRDYEASETVNAAIDYLGKVRASGMRDTLKDILNGEESRFLSGAIRSLGKIPEEEAAAETAEYLVDYYTSRDPGDENRRLIIGALGDLKAKQGTAFLVSIAENEDERPPLRMTALESLAKIADPLGLSAVITAVSSRDPNVRSSAVGALGPFSGGEAEDAIIEAFRDSYYRTRIAAAKAAGERKLSAAVPFLRFRAENDDVPQVRDEAVKAIGVIGGTDSEQILRDLFKERKNSDRIRINAGEMLLTQSSTDHVSDVIIELDEAKTKNQTALYNGFLRILGGAKSPKLEDLVKRFFAGGGVVEKSYALDICLNNNFQSLAGEIRKLADPKNGSLSRKSLALLEKWGLPVNVPDSPTEETAGTAANAGTAAPPAPGSSGAAGSTQ